VRSLFGDEDTPVSPPSAGRMRDGRPLAARMRPQTLEEYVGQEAIIGAGRPLRVAIERDELPSLILWGPPGTGKTTLAELIAKAGKAHFVSLSAVSAGVADLRRVVADAAALKRTGRATVLFIDEIHRFNRGQQDAVLPHVEDGTITLIGATTENPSFEVNSALLSRTRVFVLQSLSNEDIARIITRALADPERGLGREPIDLDEAARTRLIDYANGDARAALNTLEFAAHSAMLIDERRVITLELLTAAMAKRASQYDKNGEAHYDIVSAFIKSIRGSDPDAALYWLARMIEGGEDPLFIVRRLVILASEDIGLADSNALTIAVAAQQAVHFVGMPEGHYALAHAVLYLATAPKGNAVGRAYDAALADVRETRNDPVPMHLRNAPTALMRNLGYGEGYRYAHSDPSAAIDGDLPPTAKLSDFRPVNVASHRYFLPGTQGAEARLAAWVEERYRSEP